MSATATAAREACSLRAAASLLAGAGIENAPLEARLLAAHALGADAQSLLGVRTVSLSRAQRARFDEALARRAAREPLAYIVGRREFWSLTFKTAPGVLIPRPDSETVVEAVLRARGDRTQAYKILDWGTGTGCLLLSLLSEYKAARGVGLDISPPALALARENAAALALSSRARFLEGDWRGAYDLPTDGFDILVSNPPYIPAGDMGGLMRDVAAFEPRLALDGGADGLDAYRCILPAMRALAAPGALIVLECGAGQAQRIAELARGAGFLPGGVAHDLAGVARCVASIMPG